MLSLLPHDFAMGGVPHSCPQHLKTVKVSEVSQKEKDKYIIFLICGIYKNGTDELVCKTEIEL